MAVSPDNPAHRDLEAEVGKYLRGRGFDCASLTYHDHLPPDMHQRLRFVYTPTALYIRHRADRIAVHPILPIVFEWEVKTHLSGRYHDWCIDALPFIHHVIVSRNLRVRCLFCYRDETDGRRYNVGFWSDGLPILREFKLPPQREKREALYYRWLITTHFPEVRLNECGGTLGTDDPFVVIDENTVAELPDWRNLIDDVIPYAPSQANRQPAGAGARMAVRREG